jgi:hypothetical protein
MTIGTKVQHQMFDGTNPLPFSDHTGIIIKINSKDEVQVQFKFGTFDIFIDDLIIL